jgi:hypothetical protein
MYTSPEGSREVYGFHGRSVTREREVLRFVGEDECFDLADSVKAQLM